MKLESPFRFIPTPPTPPGMRVCTGRFAELDKGRPLLFAGWRFASTGPFEPGCLARRTSNLVPRVRQISPGKNADLHPTPAVFTALPLGSLGFRLVMQAHPSKTASPTVRGPRALDLPPAYSPRPLTGSAVALS